MVNRPKNKGTSAESMVVSFLRAHGWPFAERRALTGSVDQGDVTGTPGIVWEVKYAGAGIRMGEWVGETLTELLNANADHGVLVIKPRGVGSRNIDKWLAVMTAQKFGILVASIFRPTFDISYSEPGTYHRDSLVTELRQFSATTTTSSEIPVLVRRPPGSKEDPGSWYCIMYLESVTNLLRSAGYGEPLTSSQANPVLARQDQGHDGDRT